MPDLPGICGPANRPCKIAHVSSYPNDVGIYPSQCLPSTFTIWHAVFASQFAPALTPEEPTGLPIGGIVFPLGGLIPTLPETHTFQSHHYVIFARTANRFNIAYVVTEEDMDRVDDFGEVEIDIGEYVFEAVSVTKDPIVDIEEQIELTDAEVNDLDDDPNCGIGCSAEGERDRKFRKLFEINIPNNLLIGVVFNKEGVEYRLDNGSRKSKDAIDQAGLGDLDNPSYRDGTSKKIKVRFVSNPADPDNDVKKDDIIYFTYVAVREHYLRQRVSISWQVFDPGTAEFASTCISLMLGYSVAHYRFYEWDMEAEPGQTTKLAGWRIVESFSSDVNFVAPVLVGNEVVLADFLVGGAEFAGIKETPVLPGISTPSELRTFMDDRKSMSNSEFIDKYGISINLTDIINNGAYHVNAGKTGTANTAYQDSDWFQRNQFSKYLNRLNASNHVFYNVHPKALRKRDIDKWGIERYLAIEIEKDVKSGKTFFPFMDDPEVDDPTEGANDFLDGTNLLFQPILPVSSYGGNFDAVCGSIGSFPTNPSDGINSYHSFESNRIDERFEIDTHILVEQNFAVGAGILGPNLLTIECSAGVRGAVTCIIDPSGVFAFAGHTNDDNFATFNPFNVGYIDAGIRKLIFRPDQNAPPVKNNNAPTVSQFEELLGFSSMLGDIPGYQPGRAISSVAFSSLGSLVFKTTGTTEELKSKIPGLEDDQIEEITFEQDSSISINVSNGYFGSMKITYSIPKDSGAAGQSDEAILLAKTGSTISSIVDTINIQDSQKQITMSIDLRWIRANNFELIGPRIQYMNVDSMLIKGISFDQTGDFLENASSHTQASVDATLSQRMEGRNLFFETSVITASEDEHSILYFFFSDTDGGISTVTTNDFGDKWHYHYGVIEKIAGREILYPFAVTDFGSNVCYLFHLYSNKILCKKIPFSLFKNEDANLIERFADIYTPVDPNDSESVASESESIFTEEGHILRRRIPSFVAKGDLTEEAFLELLGKVPGEFEYRKFETRLVGDDEITELKVPIARSPGTAFTNQDQLDMFFSAYHNEIGELKLWFMDKTSNESQLQCNLSIDDGQTWYDFWEFIEYGYNRLRYDPTQKTQFIDRSASGDPPASFEGTDPEQSNQSAPFGINVHWSRLKRHKVDEGEVTISSESQVLEISSPYLFHQPATDRVFLFYIYQGCLLCKVFDESIFSYAAVENSAENMGPVAESSSGMTFVKRVIERETKAHFIDGSLASETIQEELHRFVKDGERMAEGNIIFRYPFAISSFTDDRLISDQRVCAHDLPNTQARVFYKHKDSNNIKTAIWTGSEWWAEDFLRDPANLSDMDLPDNTDITLVSGGFDETGFDD